jgi:cysteinyl-tRNA synthetase
VYPHHESHFAQLRAITSIEKPVQFWTYVGLLKSKGMKMSKSLGNIVTIRQILKKYGANVLRLYLYSRHYRQDFEFIEKELEHFLNIDQLIKVAATSDQLVVSSSLDFNFFRCIEDDFDTEGALKIMIKAARLRKVSNAMVRIFGLKY